MQPVAFPWQEKNDNADVGLSSGWRREAFMFLSLAMLSHNRFEQKSNEEVNEVWIFNQYLTPCLSMISNFLGSKNT